MSGASTSAPACAGAAANPNVSLSVRAHAARVPGRPALAWPGPGGGWRQITYRAFDDEVDAFAHGLRAFGVAAGAQAALLVPPSPELFSLLFALLRIGAVPVLVDPGVGWRAVARGMGDLGVDVFVGVRAAQLLRWRHPSAFSSTRRVVLVGTGRPPRPLAAAAGQADRRRAVATLEDLRQHGAGRGTFVVDDVAAGATALISFTTGSTGPQKPVVITHGGAAAIARSVVDLLRPDDGDVTLVTSPAMAVVDLLAGTSPVLAPMDLAHPGRADGAQLAGAIERFGARHLFASPALLARLVAHCARLPSLRSVVVGGAPAGVGLLRDARALLAADARLLVTYGATEALPIASIDAREIVEDTAAATAQGAGACLGRAVPGVDVRLMPVAGPPLLDDVAAAGAGVDIGAGVGAGVGEIAIRGAVVSPRYQPPRSSAGSAPAAAAPSPHDRDHKLAGGWHRTGDLARRDDEGRLWFVGRLRHRVVTAAGPLDSVAVEGIFDAHPAVARSALVGVPATATAARLHPFDPARPVVVVQLHPEAAADTTVRARTLDELRQLAHAHPATAGIDTFLVHPSLPVDVRHNAKIKREELAAWARMVLLPSRPSALHVAAAAVPVAGWVLVVWGFVAPLPGVWRALWAVALFFSVVVHGLQLVVALPIGRRAARSTAATVLLTLLLGAAWWKPLQRSLER
jgi:acyl-CoA synthetase (AMP-forming)/AMP-acid ligase II